MLLETKNLTTRDAYKLLISTVLPRPIAFVTSLNEDGLVNAAPYSFFNAMGADPPILAINVGNRDSKTPKDTALNIESRGEYVVNVVSESLAQQMNVCAVPFPPDISEIDAANLDLEASQVIAVPRLANTPAAFECRHHTTVTIGKNRVILGEVVAFYVADEFFDAEKLHVAFNDLKLIGRTGGANGYVRTSDAFEMERLDFQKWREQQQGQR